jgi:hypothetical protein
MPWSVPRRTSVGMTWFRKHIKHGSRLALLALALQFALSFGHFHNVAQAAPAIQAAAAQPELSDAVAATDAAGIAAQQPASSGDPDQQPADGCAICAVIALAGTGLSATPPALPLPHAVEFFHSSTDAAFPELNPASRAFQPRAPPAA